MNDATIAFWALCFTVGIQAAAVLIWGATLTQRVRRLEQEIIPLREMPEKMGRLEERLDSLIEQFRELNAAVRWMREPATETMINPHRK